MQQDNNFELRKENFSLKQKNQMLEKKLEKAEKLLTNLFNTAIGYGNEEYHKRTIEEYKQFMIRS